MGNAVGRGGGEVVGESGSWSKASGSWGVGFRRVGRALVVPQVVRRRMGVAGQTTQEVGWGVGCLETVDCGLGRGGDPMAQGRPRQAKKGTPRPGKGAVGLPERMKAHRSTATGCVGWAMDNRLACVFGAGDH